MKIALIQNNPFWENKEKNITAINNILKSNYDNEDLIIFPEMTLTGFTMNGTKHAEEIDGAGTLSFIRKAQELRTNIIAGIIENFNGKVYNTATHFDNFGLIKARYRKIHPFSYAGEDKSYSAGKDTVVTKIDNIRAGLSVCYDLRFPELYRNYAKERAPLIINIANWPEKRIAHWYYLLKARAIENQAFTIGVNRRGKDPYNNYPGRSVVFDPQGEELLVMDENNEWATIEIDTAIVEETREKLPFLNDIKMM